jgi:pSer/pThr/pTyr-binding forkhead associated (FHA) protein
VECVIRIIKGPDEGQRFECSGNEAVVGRSPRSQVRLGSPTASYEHAVITRNGDDYYIENLSAAGTYVNEERITGKVRLRSRDQLRFGTDTVARVESVPAGGGGSARRRWLLVALLVMILAGGAVLLLDPFAAPQQRLNIRGAYPKLESWTQEEVRAKSLPREAHALLVEAWRLEMSGDKTSASKNWVKLSVLLDGVEQRTGYQQLAQKDPTALERLASPRPGGGDAEFTGDEMGAALVQFVSRMARTR